MILKQSKKEFPVIDFLILVKLAVSGDVPGHRKDGSTEETGVSPLYIHD